MRTWLFLGAFAALLVAAQAHALPASVTFSGGGSAAGRILMTGPATLYVSSSGNDATCDGTLAKPCATISGAYALDQATLDHAGKWVTTATPLNSLTGSQPAIGGPLVGGFGAGTFVVKGPGLSITGTAGFTIITTNGASLTIDGMTIIPAPTSIATAANTDSQIVLSNDLFPTNGGHALFDTNGGTLTAVNGTIQNSGALPYVGISEDNGKMYIAGTWTMSGTPTWTQTFMQGDLGGGVDMTGCTISGAYSGPASRAIAPGWIQPGGCP